VRRLVALLVLLAAVSLAPIASAHRMSGKPRTLVAKLRLARAQVAHDRATGDPWLARDMKHLRQLKRLLAVPPHYRGWSCITNGAYPGAPHEGNGYAGSYSGPLGMTTPWMGYRPPGRDWVHSRIVDVYWIAERVSARQGFSWSWMKGQWPNTFPPCARWF
jgi:hypothetical protein